MSVPQTLLSSPAQNVSPDVVSGRDAYVPAANISGPQTTAFQSGGPWANYDNASANGQPASNDANSRLAQMMGNQQIGSASGTNPVGAVLAGLAAATPFVYNALNSPSGSNSSSSSTATGGNANSSSSSTASPQTSQSQTTTNNTGSTGIPIPSYDPATGNFYLPGITPGYPAPSGSVNSVPLVPGSAPSQAEPPIDNTGPIQGPQNQATAFNTPYDQFGLTGGGTQTASPAPAPGTNPGFDPYAQPVPPPPMDAINAYNNFLKTGSLYSYTPNEPEGDTSNVPPVDQGALDAVLNGGGE